MNRSVKLVSPGQLASDVDQNAKEKVLALPKSSSWNKVLLLGQHFGFDSIPFATVQEKGGLQAGILGGLE